MKSKRNRALALAVAALLLLSNAPTKTVPPPEQWHCYVSNGVPYITKCNIIGGYVIFA